MLRFTAKLLRIGTWTILRIPKDISAKLLSRGQVMVEGTINAFHFRTPLEPDGQWSHWFKVDEKLLKSIDATVGDEVDLEITSLKQWPEPTIPTDLKDALVAHPKAYALWQSVTPMARWEWIRWMRATTRQKTRMRRIEVTISKLSAGERRPCCWNRNLCTEPAVSKNGVLLDSVDTST